MNWSMFRKSLSDLVKKTWFQRICTVLIALVIVTIFLVWATLRPMKPRFILQDTTVFAFNLSEPNLVTPNFQVTISSRNPNSKIGIFYDGFDVYAAYRNERITLGTAVRPTYQGHRQSDVWSPYVYGMAVQITPQSFFALGEDQQFGLVELEIRVDGHLRWKVGAFITGKYHLHVRCPAFIALGNKVVGVPVAEDGVMYTLLSQCSVRV